VSACCSSRSIHFDRIHSQRAFQSLMQQEMIRVHRGEENALASLVDKVFRPTMARVQQVYQEGRDSGELIKVDELQIMYAALGANVFYFLSAPVMGMLTGTNPFDRSALKFRRKAAIEYLGALFSWIANMAPMSPCGCWRQRPCLRRSRPKHIPSARPNSAAKSSVTARSKSTQHRQMK